MHRRFDPLFFLSKSKNPKNPIYIDIYSSKNPKRYVDVPNPMSLPPYGEGAGQKRIDGASRPHAHAHSALARLLPSLVFNRKSYDEIRQLDGYEN